MDDIPYILDPDQHSSNLMIEQIEDDNFFIQDRRGDSITLSWPMFEELRLYFS